MAYALLDYIKIVTSNDFEGQYTATENV